MRDCEDKYGGGSSMGTGGGFVIVVLVFTPCLFLAVEKQSFFATRQVALDQ